MITGFVLAQQGGASSSNIVASFLPIILIIGIFYLLIYRPMRRRQKSHEAMLGSLKNGDKVITSGGVYGTITGIRDNTVLLKVADQVKVEIAKSAIASMQGAPGDSSSNT